MVKGEGQRKGIEAVIFDHDGLLVDTEDHWFRACQYVCDLYGVELTEEHRLELMRSYLSRYLVERFNIPEDVQKISNQLRGKFDELSKDTALMPGARSTVELLYEHYPLGVGTGSVTDQVSQALTDVGLRDYFGVIVGQDQVKRGKPAPDIYLKTAERLGVDTSRCLVFEDQPRGVEAAKAAGMLCAAVPNLYLNNPNFDQADLTIDSLDEVSLAMIAALKRRDDPT